MLALGWGIAPTAAAQVAAAPASTTRADLTEFTARAVTRLALLDLRANPSPLPADFAITHELLGIAESLAPNDAEIVRRRIETAWGAGNHDALLAGTQKLVRLDPDDTVAQLRLITSRIGRLQTASERMAAYDAFLGPRGAGLDASVRSRLALDAAMLARERGDEALFIARLKDALRLDSTNKDAALLAFNFHAGRSSDTRARLDLLSNLLLADPLDLRTIRMFRDECATVGAYKAALRFHVLERQIVQKAGATVDANYEGEGFVLEWQVEGAEAIIKTLTTQVEAERAKVRFADEMDPTRADAPNAMRPEDIRLDIPFEQVRALALTSLGEAGKDRLRESIVDFERTVANKMQGLGDPLRRPGNMNEAQALEAARDMLLEMHFFRILVGLESPEQMGELANLEKDVLPTDARGVGIVRWRAVQEGRFADGAGEIPPAAMSVWVRLARAEALARGENPADAAPHFMSIAREFPLQSIGAWSRRRAAECDAAAAIDANAATVQAAADAIPLWLDFLPEYPRQAVSLWAEVGKASKSALEFEPVRLAIRNVSSVPLGFGSARAINSRFFFGPNLEIGIRSRGDHTAGEVIELDRRLRLLPGEELTAAVWPEVGMAGWLQELGSDKPSRLRWRIMQGFETRQNGAREVGPGCVEVTTKTVSREALPESRLTAEKLTQRIAAATDVDIPAVLVGVRCKVLGGEIGAQPDPASPALIEALVKAYPGWSPTARLLAVASLPPVGTSPAMAAFDAVARDDADPRVRLVFAITRTIAADDALLTAIANGPDAAAALAAKHHAERLGQNVQTYSRVGPRGAPVKAPK